MTAPLAQALTESGLLLEQGAPAYAKHGLHATYTVSAEALPRVARLFADHGYFLEMLTCLDERAQTGKLRLIYTFNVFGPADRHRVAANVDPGEEAPSITSIYSAADWNEREVFDMFGVRFAGHPNLKRLLLPEDATFHALLKDFGRMDEGSEAPAKEKAHGHS
ncbi:MAG: NADH-quinone oxidoreductase subunit C [Deltaproteobacteria bacterium]|nr:NADH-quinone oxidoreductase subunit C [Deltaproteobacteria bacterium]